MSVYEMAKKYYPTYWSEERLRRLVEAGKLTEDEFEEITQIPYKETE